MRSGSWKRFAVLAVGLALAGLTASAGRAEADVVPFVDCVTPGPGTVNVYFGYTNDGEQQTIAFGEQNQVVPGIGYQGQPTVFNQGTYQRVFRAVWNQEAFTGLVWALNGHEALATRTGPSPSPTCIAGATGPASNLTPTTATLNAVVGVAGQRTSYEFEYGAGETLDHSTPPTIQETGQHGAVQELLTGLTPGTLYVYRVVATNEDETTQGEVRTFTTPAVMVPPTPATTPSTPSGATTSAAPTPPPGDVPFAISVRALPTRSTAIRRQDCAQQMAGGVVITSNRPGTAVLSAKAGTLIVATRHVRLTEGRNVVTLCLNKAGRESLEAAPGSGRTLRARVAVRASAGAERASAAARSSFGR